MIELSAALLRDIARDLDERGRVTIQKRQERGRLWYQVYVRIPARDPGRYEALQAALGGALFLSTPRAAHRRYAAGCRAAEALLEALLPYLTACRPQAEVALRLRHLNGPMRETQRSGGRRCNIAAPEGYWDRCEDLWAICARLNAGLPRQKGGW